MLVAADLQLLLCTPHGVRCFCYLRYIFFHFNLALSKMAHVADHLSFPYTFLLPCCAILVHNCGSCCIIALSHRLTQKLHEYIESSPNKMYAHAKCKEFDQVCSLLPLAGIHC